MFRLQVLLPKRYRKWVEDFIRYSSMEIAPATYINFILLLGVVLPISVTALVTFLGIFPFKFALLFIWLPTFIGFFITFHLILVFTADKRANFSEEILPDVLQLFSLNVRSGLTLERAILTSARPEFGPLEQELKRVANETLAGTSLGESLKGISKRIKSKLIDRTISLLVEGMEKGGNIADLLDNLAEHVRQAKILRREMKSYVVSYVIFIFIAVGIGAPLLYAISTFLVQTMIKFGSVDLPKAPTLQTGLPLIRFEKVDITPKFLRNYSILALLVSALFGSLLIGLISEGTERAGIKFIPILAMVSLGILFIARVAISSMFGAFVG